jgi:acetyl-CoA carboxylase carboxyltransferase component
MGGQQASSVLLSVRLDNLRAEGHDLSEQEQKEFVGPILKKYEEEGSPYYSTSRLWDDGILDPLDTRSYLALGISASLNAPIPDTQFGVFRM